MSFGGLPCTSEAGQIFPCPLSQLSEAGGPCRFVLYFLTPNTWTGRETARPDVA